MALFEQFKDNPLVQADLMRMSQQPQQTEQIPDQNQFIELGKAGKLTHMGGKLPDFLRGLVTEAKDFAKKAIKGNEFTIDNTVSEPAEFNTDLAVESLMGHESRGTDAPLTTVAAGTGATGSSQITPIMIDQYNKLTGEELSTESLLGNETLQKDVTKALVDYLIGKYDKGLDEDWPTKTPRLKRYKEEIKSKFTEPIHWIAGEWVAGPNWVAKLDNPTAPGATETVRDYIQKVGDLYKGRTNKVAINQ